MPETQKSAASPMVSIIVPARNEEACLGTCLESLVAQTGVNFEIIAVDDHSTDRTREIASSFPAVRVIEASPLPDGWTGKNNAVVAGASAARGEWLLFTDADTMHLPGSLARALKEAQENNADLLSYSPEQIAVTFWEMAVLPVVFAELARQYPPSKVSDPNSPEAAANGQYILVKREAYDAAGGHGAIAGKILEDVALARAIKASGRKIRFRYAADAVRTRMYRNYHQLRDGWTKNLALLFPNPLRLAAWSFIEFFVTLSILNGLIQMLLLGRSYIPSASVLLPHYPIPDRQVALFNGLMIAFTTSGLLFVWLRSALRTRTAHFPLKVSTISMLGLPMFGYLLIRSVTLHNSGGVSWKGRTYSDKGGLLAPDH
jgi:glycosyltransferase involved in cell wall biosynthesis